MYKKFYLSFLEANTGIQYYSKNRHHHFLDVARFGAYEYRNDLSPETQKLIANVLKLSTPSQIAFASNIHEFVSHLLNTFDPEKKIKVLTTDSEFYCFAPQVSHAINTPKIEIEKVQVDPFDNFEERFIEKMRNNTYDIIFFSHVFFNSGMAVKNLKAIVEAIKDDETMVVIDGYHSFMALPTDLSDIESRVFYLCCFGKGEYCFFHVPENYTVNKDWFVKPELDHEALYRLNAVLNLFHKENLTIEKIHAHIQFLQNNFREHLLSIDHNYLTEKNIMSVDYNYHGHFLTFAMPSPEHAKKLHAKLLGHKIITEYRESKLHFGFGLYQNDVIDLTAMKWCQ